MLLWYTIFLSNVFKKKYYQCTPIRNDNFKHSCVHSMDTCIQCIVIPNKLISVSVCIVTTIPLGHCSELVLPCCMPSTQPSTFQSSQLALKSRSGSSLALKSRFGSSLALEQTS
jgi:hypothetical protein